MTWGKKKKWGGASEAKMLMAWMAHQVGDAKEARMAKVNTNDLLSWGQFAQ